MMRFRPLVVGVVAAAIVSAGSVAAFTPTSTARRLASSPTVVVRPGPSSCHQQPSPVASYHHLTSTSRAAIVNGDASNNTKKKSTPPTLSESLLSASLLVALDVGFRKLFQAMAITFPSSLGGCCILLLSMLVLPLGSDLFHLLSPGAALLAKWLPVFFVPSLITLPLAGSVGPPLEV